MVKLLPHGGKIAVFVGTFSADNAAQRLKGIDAKSKEEMTYEVGDPVGKPVRIPSM